MNKKKKIETFKKKNLISIRYFTNHQLRLKEHQFSGLCLKKNKTTLTLKSKTKLQRLFFKIYIKSPVFERLKIFYLHTKNIN